MPVCGRIKKIYDCGKTRLDGSSYEDERVQWMRDNKKVKNEWEYYCKFDEDTKKLKTSDGQ